jgi:hypothetical protein
LWWWYYTLGCPYTFVWKLMHTLTLVLSRIMLNCVVPKYCIFSSICNWTSTPITMITIFLFIKHAPFCPLKCTDSDYE